VIGVWIGRPDGAAMPGVLGVDLAAPVLIEAFARAKPVPVPLLPPPPGVLTVGNAELPPPLRRFRHRGAEIADAGLRPEIAFPPDGARVEGDAGFGGEVALKLRSGVPPFLWLIDGAPLGPPGPEREAVVHPGGGGVRVDRGDRRHGGGGAGAGLRAVSGVAGQPQGFGLWLRP
jgi:penicillin-binding protein 1C